MTSIIIVTHNSEKTIGALLESLAKHLEATEYEAIVVDNNSSDKTVDIVEGFTDVKLVKEQVNTGFSAACHTGVTKSRGTFLLFLNPDTLFTENSLKVLLPKFSDSSIGVIGVRQLHPDNTLQPSVRRFPTWPSQLLIFFKIPYVFPNLPALKRYYNYAFDYDHESKVDQVMGAFFLTPRKVWDELGGFDKRFFIWYEEVDYCFQLKKRGYSTLYTPETSIVHISGHSFSQENFFKKMFWFARSMFAYLLKNNL